MSTALNKLRRPTKALKVVAPHSLNETMNAMSSVEMISARISSALNLKYRLMTSITFVGVWYMDMLAMEIIKENAIYIVCCSLYPSQHPLHPFFMPCSHHGKNFFVRMLVRQTYELVHHV